MRAPPSTRCAGTGFPDVRCASCRRSVVVRLGRRETSPPATQQGARLVQHPWRQSDAQTLPSKSRRSTAVFRLKGAATYGSVVRAADFVVTEFGRRGRPRTKTVSGVGGSVPTCNTGPV